MPQKEWMEKYEAIKEKLTCKIDLDAYYWKLGMCLFLQVRYSHVIR